MPQKKPGFTLEQHDKLGLELQTIRDKFTKIVGELSKAYGKETTAYASRALDDMDELRSRMDEHICEEQRNNSSIDLNKYYYRANRDDYLEPKINLAP